MKRKCNAQFIAIVGSYLFFWRKFIYVQNKIIKNGNPFHKKNEIKILF